MQRNWLRWVLRLLFRWLCRVEAIGLENVPRQGGAILAVNHLSRLDPPLVYALVERDDVTALVAEKYRKYPGFNWVINLVKGIYINRGEADLKALRQARDYLQAGGILGVAPEGTRSRSGALIEAKTGVAYLADKAGVPVIPVAISGTEKAIAQLLRLRRPFIRIQFGKALFLPPIEREQREAALRRNTDEIMCHIAAMLPAQYRGVYAHHPRLQELLAGDGREGVGDSEALTRAF